jgi:hypothetical protein
LSFNFGLSTFICMSHAATPTKGPSTVDCEVLTGKNHIPFFLKKVVWSRLEEKKKNCAN